MYIVVLIVGWYLDRLTSTRVVTYTLILVGMYVCTDKEKRQADRRENGSEIDSYVGCN